MRKGMSLALQLVIIAIVLILVALSVIYITGGSLKKILTLARNSDKTACLQNRDMYCDYNPHGCWYAGAYELNGRTCAEVLGKLKTPFYMCANKELGWLNNRQISLLPLTPEKDCSDWKDENKIGKDIVEGKELTPGRRALYKKKCELLRQYRYGNNTECSALNAESSWIIYTVEGEQYGPGPGDRCEPKKSSSKGSSDSGTGSGTPTPKGTCAEGLKCDPTLKVCIPE